MVADHDEVQDGSNWFNMHEIRNAINKGGRTKDALRDCDGGRHIHVIAMDTA